MGNRYNVHTFSLITIAKNAPPPFLPMTINVKQLWFMQYFFSISILTSRDKIDHIQSFSWLRFYELAIRKPE